MGVHRRKILSAVGASMALIGGLLAATALVGVVPAGAVTLWAPTTACGVFDTTTVPAGVTSMTIKVEGAAAGAAGSGTSSGTEKSDPGFGGKVTATVAVAPGATISAVVGCQGGNFPSSNCGGNPTRPASSAGWSKGGAGGSLTTPPSARTTSVPGQAGLPAPCALAVPARHSTRLRPRSSRAAAEAPDWTSAPVLQQQAAAVTVGVAAQPQPEADQAPPGSTERVPMVLPAGAPQAGRVESTLRPVQPMAAMPTTAPEAWA